MMVRWDELPKSPGPAFYDHLQAVLKEGDVDTFAAELCQPFYAARMATPSLPPGRDFRMHLGSHF